MEEIGVQRRSWHFTMIENKLLESEKLTTYDKLTFVMLCKFASRDANTCFPSQNLLAKYVGCSRKTINESISKLEKLGIIEKEQRITEEKGQIPNMYIINDLETYVENL